MLSLRCAGFDMGTDRVKRLAKKYYPAFTFDDGLMAVLIFLTAVIFIGGDVSEILSAKAIVKLLTGWIGTVWVVGGRHYFSFVRQRLALAVMMKKGFTAVPCAPQFDAKEDRTFFRKRFKCYALINGVTYRVTTGVLAAGHEHGGFLLMEKDGRGVVFMPDDPAF